MMSFILFIIGIFCFQDGHFGWGAFFFAIAFSGDSNNNQVRDLQRRVYQLEKEIRRS